ncbi:MAG: GNAT family N-acetyltransferase [Bacilli bacterium]|nr:GNAT family N-acetyltransferase [Bacilli bacterium]MBQ9853937.1 GNAT family N-acetyltransferase [Bacilli bacterium]
MRLSSEKDIEQLSKLRIQQQKDDWDDEYEDKYNLLNTTIEYLNKHLNKDLFIFIEESNNIIIATCGIQIIEYLPQCNDNGLQGFICNVYTDKKYRCKGIQTKLLKQVISFAKEKNLCELSLSTDNDKAISIYKKMGFKFDDLIMSLKLN